MNTRSFFFSRGKQLVTALIAACAVFGSAVPTHAAWQHAHGDSDNTGFAYVDTVPAGQPINAAWLGRVAPGANPVVAADGTVYIGTMTGELQAFRPDGRLYWKRQVNPAHGGFYASPVVGADGSIYIVSTKPRVVNQLNDSFLHKFLPGGGWLGGRLFPIRGSDGGATTAPPNIWRHNGQEAIIVPVKYTHVSFERRLIAFSTQQNVISDMLVSFTPIEVTGTGSSAYIWALKCIAFGAWNFGAGCWLASGTGFDAPVGPTPLPTPINLAGYPMGGVAIVKPRQAGEAPTITVADDKHDRVGYAFSMQTGLTEISRVTNWYGASYSSMPPVALDEGIIVSGDRQGYLNYHAGSNRWGWTGPLGSALTAAPTRLFGGNIAVVSRDGNLTLSKGRSIVYKEQLSGPSIASVAASCKHFFVSTERELVTYDTKNNLVVGRYTWQAPYVEGGLHAPVIGPTGYVYAVVRYSQANAEGLYVFPRPANGGVGTPQGCTVN